MFGSFVFGSPAKTEALAVARHLLAELRPNALPRCRRQQTNACNKVYEPYTLKLKQQVLVVGSGLGVRPLAQIETAFQVDPALFLLYIYVFCF